MKLKALYHLGNWGPLMSWSGCSILLGTAISIHELGSGAIDWGLLVFASIGVVLLQYVAHPVNDILDYNVDGGANIAGTGRHKVLYSGLATKGELAWFSAGVIAIVVVIMLGVAYFRPLALLFGMIGFFGLWSYNWTPLKLSYYPFSELVVDIPVNLAMVMGISFVAVNQVLYPAFVMGIIQTFMAMSVHISYFSMDTESDHLGGKTSTVVRYPQYPWCTIYSALGLVAIGVFIITGSRPSLFVIPTMLFAIVTYLGARMDFVRSTYLRKHGRAVRRHILDRFMGDVPSAVTDTWNAASTEMRKILVRQTATTIVNGVLLSLALVYLL